jgi:phosphonate transport system substrate-binding protein
MTVRKDLPTSFKMAVKGAFLSLKDKELLAKMKIAGYVPGDDAFYNPVRELIKLKKALKKKK